MIAAAKIRPINLSAGADVFRENDPANGEMFFIFQGEVSIAKTGIGHLRSLSAGHFFGEMALIKNMPRTATATVTSAEAKIGAINLNTFAYLAKTNPKFLSSLISVVAKRALRAIDKLESYYI